MALLFLPTRRRVGGIADFTIGTGTPASLIWRPEEMASGYPYKTAASFTGSGGQTRTDTPLGPGLRINNAGDPGIVWSGNDPITQASYTFMFVGRFLANTTANMLLHVGSNTPQIWFLGNRDRNAGTSAGRVSFLHYKWNYNNSTDTDETIWGDMQPRVYVGVRRGASTPAEIWIDGRQPPQTQNTTTADADYHASDAGFAIGRNITGGYVGEKEVFAVALWNTALTPAQLAQLSSPEAVIGTIRGWSKRRIYLDLGLIPVTRAPGLGTVTLAGAAGSAFRLQYARPATDVSADGWKPITGASLAAMIDESGTPTP